MAKQDAITIDVDGVMEDYHTAYAKLWQRVFGEYPVEVDKNAYWAHDRYAVRHLEGAELEHFNSFKDEQFWTSFEAMPGALAACYKLKELFPDVKLIAVSALPPEANEWRKRSLLDLKFPIDECYATGNGTATPHEGPKTFLLNQIMPRYHADDHLPYFRGLHPKIRQVLIHRSAHDRRSHNHDAAALKKVHQRHPDLSAWVDFLAQTLENPA